MDLFPRTSGAADIQMDVSSHHRHGSFAESEYDGTSVERIANIVGSKAPSI